MTQFESRNITMMMDLYEMTMAYGYFKENDTEKKVAFDVFYRKNPDGGGFSIFAGLEQVIEYLENMHFEDEDVESNNRYNKVNSKVIAFIQKMQPRRITVHKIRIAIKRWEESICLDRN